MGLGVQEPDSLMQGQFIIEGRNEGFHFFMPCNHIMGRIPVVDCSQCGTPGLRRIYMQNAAGSGRPRHEPVMTWLYCQSCDTMHAKKRVTP